MVSATVIDCLPNNLINIPHLCTLRYFILHETDDGRLDIKTRIDAAMAGVSEETSLKVSHTYKKYRERQDLSEALIPVERANLG